MTKVVCPGSFDPVTNGHLDIIERASQLFDEVIVVVLINETKRGLFSTEERLALISDALPAEVTNVTVDSFSGLLVDYCSQNGVDAIVKGLRAVSDFDYELQMAQMNGNLTGIDTVFIPTSPEYTFIASSLVKEVAKHGGEVENLVPANVLAALDTAYGH